MNTKLFDKAIPLRNELVSDEVEQSELDSFVAIAALLRGVHLYLLPSGRWRCVGKPESVGIREDIKRGGVSQRDAFEKFKKAYAKEIFFNHGNPRYFVDGKYLDKLPDDQY